MFPRLLTPTLFRLAARFRLDGVRWMRALTLHALFAALASQSCTALGMLGIRAVIMDYGGNGADASWQSYVQRLYLQNLDWTLMVYAAIVGLSYAVRTTASRRRAR